MSFKEKYLKYKNKYINLKLQQIGGLINNQDEKQIINLINQDKYNFNNYKEYDSKKNLLDVAARNKYYELVKLLIEKGLRDKSYLDYGNNALMDVCEDNNIEIATLLLNKHDENYINITNINEENAVSRAAYKGNNDIIKLLFDRGASYEDSDFKNYLLGAVKGKKIETLKYLIEIKKNKTLINITSKPLYEITNFYGDSMPEMECINRYNIAEELLKNGADPNINFPPVSNSAFMNIINEANKFKNIIEFIDLLIKYEANVNVVNSYKKTPLDIISQNNRLQNTLKQQIIDKLKEKGAKTYNDLPKS